MKGIALILVLLALIAGGIFLLNHGDSGDSVQLDELSESGGEEVVGATVALSGEEGTAKAAIASVDPALADLAEAGRRSLTTGLAGAIQGRVLDLLSEPVAGARLYLYRSLEVRSLGGKAPRLARTQSDERGFFRMRDLEMGSYVLRVEAEGYAVGHRSIKLNIATPRTVGMSILLRDGYSLQGLIVDPVGKAVAGAWVVAGLSGGFYAEALLPEARSDENGRFAFSLLPQGKVHVLAWAEGRSLGVAETDASLSERVRIELPEQGPFKIVFSLAENEGDKADKPVDVSVRLGLIRAGVRMPLPSPLRTLAVPAKGETTTRGLCAGTYQILLVSEEVALKGYWRSQALAVEKPEAKIEIIWMPKFPLHGRLVYKNGKPVQDIILLVQGNSMGRVSSAKSDKEGRFAFPDRFGTKARLYVSVKSPGFLFAQDNNMRTWAQVHAGEKENLLTMLPVARFSGRVVDEAGRPVKGARLWLHPQGKLREQYGWATSDAKGGFSISVTRIKETSLVLDAKSETAFCPRPLPLGGKPRVSREGLVLQLARGGWVEGQVVDDKRIGIPGINLRATFIPPPKPRDPKRRRRSWMYRQEVRTAISNREGRFRILGLSPGSWRISSSSKRLKRGADPVVLLSAGEKKGGLRLVLSEGLSITGRLVTDSGKPLAGVYLRAKFDGKLGRGAVGGNASVQSGLDGNFALKGLRAGTFVLSFRIPGQLRRELGMEKRGPDGEPPMRWRKRPTIKLVAGSKDYLWKVPIPRFGEIRASLASSGSILNHVQVLLDSGKQKWTFDRRLEQGGLSLQRVLVGSYSLTIKTPRFEGLTLRVQVQEGQVLDLGLLNLSSLPQVEGRIMTEGGQSLSGVWISLDRKIREIWSNYDLSKGQEPFDGRVMTQSGSQGYFRVPIKDYVRVFAFKPGYAPAEITLRQPKSGKGESSKSSKIRKASKVPTLVLKRAGEVHLRAPAKVQGQTSRWWVKISWVQDGSVLVGQKKPRPWSRSRGFKDGKLLRFLGLKPGTYEIQATNFSKSRTWSKKSVPGESYYEKSQVQIGTKRFIKIP